MPYGRIADCRRALLHDRSPSCEDHGLVWMIRLGDGRQAGQGVGKLVAPDDLLACQHDRKERQDLPVRIYQRLDRCLRA